MVAYPEPVELQVTRKLIALLERINPTNVDPAWEIAGAPPEERLPYEWDLRNKIFIGKSILGQDVILPAMALLESPNPTPGNLSGQNGRKSNFDFRLLLQGFAVEDKKDPTVPAYRLKAQAQMLLARVMLLTGPNRPMYPDDYLFGGVLTSFTIGQGVVRPPEDKVSATGHFYIPLTVGLAIDANNPYAQA